MATPDRGSALTIAPMVTPLMMVCLCLEFRGRAAPSGVCMAASALAGLAFLGLAETRWSRKTLVLAAVALALGSLASVLCLYRLQSQPRLPQRLVGTFRVMELRGQEGRRQIRLKGAQGRQWIASMGSALEALNLREGMSLVLEARTEALEHGTGFSALRYWRARGVQGRLMDLEVQGLSPGGPSVQRLRQFLRERLQLLPSRLQGLMGAVILGDRDPDTAEAHRRWGTSHLLAVSGWHVGLWLGLCCFLWGGGPWALGLSSLSLWGYVILSGQALSALRAASMLQISLAGIWLGRRGNGLNAVALAGTAMVLVNPFVYWDLGWQMSVLSALVLCCLMGPGPWQRLRTLAASPVLWLLTAPMAGPLAGGIFLSALPVNAMALPAFGLLLPLSLLASLPSLLGLPGGQLFALPAEGLLLLWELWADLWTQALPRALPVGFFSPGLCSFLLLGLLGARLGLGLWRTALLALAAGVWCFFLL